MDEVAPPPDSGKPVTSKEARSIHEKLNLRSLWSNVKKVRAEHKQGKRSAEELESAVDEFFAYERKNERLEILKHTEEQGILSLKQELLSDLRQWGIFVLEKGSIEDYYPVGIVGGDKPTKAQSFCSTIRTKESALALCNEVRTDLDTRRKEFEVIFDAIFRKHS